jgi:hypothetical protein
MTKPPTTLKVAAMIEIDPNRLSIIPIFLVKIRRAPKMVTADIALVIDISGVCNKEGTFDINTYPIIKAIIKKESSTKKSTINYL